MTFRRDLLLCLAGLAGVMTGACSPNASTAAAEHSLPMIIAHRGASGHAPENTLAAFRLAWEQGADGIEGDFHLTNDGHIVCLHDADTRRTAAGGIVKAVRESTLAELRELDVGLWKAEEYRGERIPALAEVMAIVPAGKKFFLEVKCGPEIIAPLLAELERGPLTRDQVTVISFNKEVIAQLKASASGWRASWLVGIKQDEGGAPQPPVFTLIEDASRLRIEAVGLQADESLDARYFAGLKVAGLERHVWTVNTPDAARRFAAFAVDSITTDVPAELRQALEAGGEQGGGKTAAR